MNPNEGSTVIGKSVVVRGELSGNEDLFLDGDLEGTVTLTENRLTIGPNARVLADLNVRDLVVFGQLTGNVRAGGRVELRQSAVVKGDILSGRLSIEESAVLQGRVELVSSVPGTAAASTPPQGQSTPAFALQPQA